MMLNDAPCYKCDKRSKGCWSTCEAYKAYDSNNKERREKSMESLKIGMYYYDREAQNRKQRERLIKKNGRRF